MERKGGRNHMKQEDKHAEGALADRVPFIAAVDDTDDLTKETSTGEIAGLMVAEAVALGAAIRLEVTRHQLLLSPDVPYTSHNSAMAFEFFMRPDRADEFYNRSIRVIEEHRAAASDPGLCLMRVPQVRNSDMQARRALANFAFRAQTEYCSKQEAFEVARSIPWVRLGEYGGTGQGVVGALAGAALRLGGGDGRFRGKWDLRDILGLAASPEETVLSGDAASRLAEIMCGPCSFVDVSSRPLPCDSRIALVGGAKPILLDGALTFVCREGEGGEMIPCSKSDLERMGDVDYGWRRVCERFEWDNDGEECADTRQSCRNCLFRRMESEGFSCSLGIDPQDAGALVLAGVTQHDADGSKECSSEGERNEA